MSKHKEKFSAWNLIWIIPLVLILAVGVMMYVVPAFEGVSSRTVEGSENWMKDLPDDMPLSQVVLPGTHDSATENVQLAYFSKCQALDIREQLDAGFRYLDIRLGDGEDLPLMHGFVNCTVSGLPWAKTLYLESVLEDCRAFLEANPSETIVFCVKHEHGEATAAEFAELLSDVISKYPDIWYSGSAVPTVGEARGKIVLLKRFPDIENKLPGVMTVWKDQKGYADPSLNVLTYKNPQCTLQVQDRFEYNADEKWTAFTEGMKSGEPDDHSICLNFLSAKGHAKYGHPFGVASALNKKLAELSPSGLCGWIIVDFGSAELAKTIYGANFD